MDKLYHVVPTDYDELFYSDPVNHSVIPAGTEITTSKTYIRDQIRELFQNESAGLTFVSTCRCTSGGLRGNFYAGVTCPVCKAKCETNFAKDTKYRGWLEVPDFAPPVLNPTAYVELSKFMGKKLINALINPSDKLPVEYEGVFGQGMSYLYNNFDDIMEYLYKHPPKRYVTKDTMMKIRKFCFVFRKQLFMRHMPVLNQSLHMLSSDGRSEYSDDSSPFIIQALVELSALSNAPRNRILGDRFMEQKLSDMYSYFFQYASTILDVKLLHKPGLFRKDILGARMFNSFRGVIVPIEGPHKFHVIRVPWVVAVTYLKEEILGRLVREYGYGFPDAISKWAVSHRKFDPEIAEIIRWLIDTCYWADGLPTLFGRQPTMILGAIQLVFIEDFATDVNDNALHMSGAIMPAPNADCDGDTMYGLGIKEMAAVHDFWSCHPMCTMLGGDQPGISGTITLPKQHVVNLTAWLNDPAQYVRSE